MIGTLILNLEQGLVGSTLLRSGPCSGKVVAEEQAPERASNRSPNDYQSSNWICWQGFEASPIGLGRFSKRRAYGRIVWATGDENEQGTLHAPYSSELPERTYVGSSSSSQASSRNIN